MSVGEVMSMPTLTIDEIDCLLEAEQQSSRPSLHELNRLLDLRLLCGTETPEAS